MSDRKLDVLFMDIKQYRALVNEADKFERALLDIPLVVDVDITGWTAQGFTEEELLSLMGYARGGNTQPKLVAALEKFKAAGVIDWYPPVGWRRRFWFSYVVRPLEKETQTHFLNVTKGHNSSDERSQLPIKNSDIMSQVVRALESLDVTKGHKVEKTGDGLSQDSVTKGHNFGTHDMSYENDLTLNPITKDHHHNHEQLTRDELLDLAMVDKNAKLHCQDIPLEKLEMEVRNAQAGHLLVGLRNLLTAAKGIQNPGGYIVQRCRHHATYPNMNPGTNYLERLAELEPQIFDKHIPNAEKIVFRDAVISMGAETEANDPDDPEVIRVRAYHAAKDQYPDDAVQRGLEYLRIALSPAPKPKPAFPPVEEKTDEIPVKTDDKNDIENDQVIIEIADGESETFVATDADAENAPEQRIWTVTRNILSMTALKQKVEGVNLDHVEKTTDDEVWYLQATNPIQFGGLQIPIVKQEIEDRLAQSSLVGRRVRIEILAPGA